jgi:hypothetical protein
MLQLHPVEELALLWAAVARTVLLPPPSCLPSPPPAAAWTGDGMTCMYTNSRPGMDRVGLLPGPMHRAAFIFLASHESALPPHRMGSLVLLKQNIPSSLRASHPLCAISYLVCRGEASLPELQQPCHTIRLLKLAIHLQQEGDLGASRSTKRHNVVPEFTSCPNLPCRTYSIPVVNPMLQAPIKCDRSSC